MQVFGKWAFSIIKPNRTASWAHHGKQIKIYNTPQKVSLSLEKLTKWNFVFAIFNYACFIRFSMQTEAGIKPPAFWLEMLQSSTHFQDLNPTIFWV